MSKIRDIVIELIRYYSTVRLFIKETVATEKRGRMTIKNYLALASNKWSIFEPGSFDRNSGLGIPDVKKTLELIEQEKTRVAQYLFVLAKIILKNKQEGNNWLLEWGSVEPKVTDSHSLLIAYSLGAFFHCGIITPNEYGLMQPQIDESSILLGMKQLPKPQLNEFEDAT